MADPGRRSPGPNAVAVVVLTALVAALLVWQQPWQGSDQRVAAMPADASARLTRQFQAFSAADSEQELVAAAGPSAAAKTFGHRTWGSLKALDVRDLELRYVSGGDASDRADGSAGASVELSWRPGARSGLADTARQTSTVVFRIVPDSDGNLSIVSAQPSEDAPLPVWLVGAVTVQGDGGATVIRVGGGDRNLPVEAMATAARSAVARLVPRAQGRVTIISPHTQREAALILGRDEGDIEQIAAVTTRLDPGQESRTDTVIVLNPSVFATMDRRAAQVVVTHEATHLLTEATGAAESWVVEGFADFVALHDDTASLSVSAGQILRKVKAGDLPEGLPSDQDFEESEHGLGAVYESAWLIFRMLGERFGDAEVVGFYEAVVGGQSLGRALDSSFGLTARELTQQWQAYLSKSASTVS